jgi:hypothetical protein
MLAQVTVEISARDRASKGMAGGEEGSGGGGGGGGRVGGSDEEDESGSPLSPLLNPLTPS